MATGLTQEQRKYLIQKVEAEALAQIQELEKKKPGRPSLNNFLIAAFLDGSIEFLSITQIQANIKAKVLALGPNKLLVEEETRWERANPYCKIEPGELFVFPAAYNQKLAEYSKIVEELDKQIAEIKAQRDTVVMKIQIGSASALDKLVMQVDNLCDLKLLNSTLKIGQGG